MAKTHATVTVGIKELKDQASAIIEKVTRTGRPVTISKNGREVAQIVPFRALHKDPYQLLLESGLVSRPARLSWDSFEWGSGPGIDATAAIAAIREDRDDE